MKFRYTASDTRGRVIEGDTEANDTTEVLTILASKGLRPVTIRVVRSEELRGLSIFGQTITVEDKVFLTKYLSLLLRAGTDLLRAIDILIQDIERPVLKAILIEIRSSLEKGQPFYTTFAKYPKYFSSVFINLIRAGETSGNLESVLANLSTSLEKDQDLKNKVKSALIYPTILLGISLSILILMVTFSLPKIANVFMSSGFEIPTFSRIVFSFGIFLNTHLVEISLLLFFVIVGSWVAFARIPAIKRVLLHFIHKIPVLNRVFKEIALQRFSSTLSLLMRSGLLILDSLEITAEAVGNEELREALLRISREGVAKGLTIGEAFKKESAFPAVISSLIAISEKGGHTEEVLKTVSNFYESEIDNLVKTLVSFLEPLLLLFIGVIIGIIALAIIVPMYQLVGNI